MAAVPAVLHNLAMLERDPAAIGYPPTFPVEIALRSTPVADVCAAYGIDQAEWNRLRYDPIFVDDLKFWVAELKKEGMPFKVKARLQAVELLKTSWKLIHSTNDEVAPAVKADLIKFTVRAAGLDGSKDQAAALQNTNALQININLGP